MYRTGFLGLIGQPNAGKSSLLNFLVDEKVSIVTSKPQTTRRRVMGLWSTDEGQIVFIDAPGLVEAEKGLNGFLQQEAYDVIQSSDALLAIISVDEKKKEDAEKVIEMVSKSGKPWMGLITKTDLKDHAHRVMILKAFIESKGAKAFQVSVKEDTKEDRENILIEALSLLPESPQPLYDSELFTTETVRDLACEIIREKCFEHLTQEVPYNIAVRITQFDEEATPCPKIFADILVSRESYKPIVIGKGGANIKNIGMDARKEIEKMMDSKVYLELKVQLREDWTDNKRLMKELGYDSK